MRKTEEFLEHIIFESVNSQQYNAYIVFLLEMIQNFQYYKIIP